jgi:hypothetical protein
MCSVVKTNAHRHVAIAGTVLVLLVISLGIGVGPTAESKASNRGPAVRAAGPVSLALARQPSATATPTPRVIIIQPTPTPGSPPTATSVPNRAALPTATMVPERAALPTATAPVIIVETMAPTRSTATPTAAPLPTAPPPPTATPLLTATPSPTAPPSPTPLPAVPTLAPARDLRISFTAEDWVGGYYRGDSQTYGRPWVAVYGALSEFPRAALTFTLDATPGRAATVSITGLDDEWAALNPVALEVNGEPVFSGPSPYQNWDGVGTGANAAWTTVPFTIPTGLLRAGPNEIAFANLTPVASFNAPPYVLLADATLEISAQAVGAPATSTTPTPVPIVPSTSGVVFAAADWGGAFYRGDNQFYGRPWSAIYGAASQYPRATIRFRLDAEPSGPATLTITGLDDELDALNPIAIEVNGQQVFGGPSPFLNWDGVGNGENAAWTAVEVTIPAELLRQGRNEIAVANLSPSGNFNGPPYVLLADATLDAPGARVNPITPGDARSQRDRGGDDDGDDD